MKVTVMSRRDAISYCYAPQNSPCVMISISDPFEEYRRGPFKTMENKVKEILHISFCDAEAPGKDVYYRDVTEPELISVEDAMKIAKFVRRHPDTDIIVHCDAGISRSAGVAAGILKAETGDDTAIFDNPYYHPNMRCYRKVYNALIDYERN